MKGEIIAIIVLAAAAVVFGILTAVLYGKMRRAVKRADEERGAETADRVKVSGGVRYSTDDVIADDEGLKITLRKGDFVLERGKEYPVEKHGEPMPGTYTALSAAENRPTFKLRVAGFVREYKHGDTVVLGEGDVIAAVSDNVILR